MNKPTNEEILAEADKLEKMKPTVRRESIFHENHHDSIDAQIEVLREYVTDDRPFDEDEVREDREENGDPENVVDAAVQAYLWADGSDDYESDYGATPSANWEELVQK